MSRNALVYDRWFQFADQDRDGRWGAPPCACMAPCTREKAWACMRPWWDGSAY